MAPRFLQIHTLTSYPASLLNRDDVGFAKRVPFGGSERTRISSQCLKRHWRTAEDGYALAGIRDGEAGVPMAVRSRRTFERYLYEPLVAGGLGSEVAHAVTRSVMEALLPEGKKRRAAKDGEGEGEGEEGGLRTEQVTVLGRPEMDYLLDLARQAARGAADAKAAAKAFETLDKGEAQESPGARSRRRARRGRLRPHDDRRYPRPLRRGGPRGARDDGAFCAARDRLLLGDRRPAGPRGDGQRPHRHRRLTTGLYYGYVVVDLPLLVSNLEGCDRASWLAADRSLAAEVVRRLLHLMATVSPGAKLGATAPYSHAAMVLGEVGTRQPRTLANAFLEAVPTSGNILSRAYERLARHLAEHDAMYGRDGERRLAAIEPPEPLLAQVDGRVDLAELARWAAEALERAA